ncbi:hypothetical protein EMIT047CA2_60282 [Pseudomonas soli]
MGLLSDRCCIFVVRSLPQIRARRHGTLGIPAEKRMDWLGVWAWREAVLLLRPYLIPDLPGFWKVRLFYLTFSEQNAGRNWSVGDEAV